MDDPVQRIEKDTGLYEWSMWTMNPCSMENYRATGSYAPAIKVAVGVAQGLCYMHHGCSHPSFIVDVKSSNILLDANFNATIADFGLAKMLVKHGESDTMSR
ncbi:hypothetical protein IFM89_015365 [Coptis chinensis]|uniref:non-specific serine/threonine protein kinase n=1 Tax=Coptis chinensis TaxID=261450 RepID=A0A835ICM5_9MAGN|nr:hypothetical protein IFM89_015365 [Coptis chinensis]